MDDDRVPVPAEHKERRGITIEVGKKQLKIYETGNPKASITCTQDELIEPPQ